MGGTSVNTSNATQSQSTTQLPPWVNTAAQQNYAQAQNIAGQPLQQYQGQLVANVGPQMQQAWNLAAQGGAAGQDQYNAAQAAYQGVLGQAPQNVQANTLGGANLSQYMNPYTQSVINATLPIMQQNLGVQQAQNAANSVAAGAFGGSRLGVQQGVTQAQGALGMAQMAAQLNQANYAQGQAGAQYDITNNLNAQLANQNAQQNQAQLNNQAAAGLGQLGQQAQMNQARNFTELYTAGNLQQQQAQNEINANLAQYQQALQYPYQQLGVLQSALGMTPYGQSTTGTSYTQGQTQTSPDWAMSALGGVQALGSMFSGGGIFSDRRMKTDISKVGRHHTGVPLYAYRYKGDPKHFPKVVGPMAEDVQRVAPHAVAEIPGSGGRRAIDMGALNALTPSMAARRAGAPDVPAPGQGKGMPRLPAPDLGRITGGQPAGLPVGALGPMAPTRGIGALGGSLRAPTPGRIRRPRGPQLRGALGG